MLVLYDMLTLGCWLPTYNLEGDGRLCGVSAIETFLSGYLCRASVLYLLLMSFSLAVCGKSNTT